MKSEIAEVMAEHRVNPEHFRLTVGALLIAFAETLPDQTQKHPELAAVAPAAEVVDAYGRLARAVIDNEPTPFSVHLVERVLVHLCGLLGESADS